MIFRLLPALAGLSLAGCIVVDSHGDRYSPPRHEFHSIDKQPLERLRVNLNMGAGHLEAGAGTEKLMTADFTYSFPDWKPEVSYHASSGRGDLTIQQPHDRDAHLGNDKYEWDVRLTRGVPIELAVHFGAGDAQLDVGRLDLDSVEVEMGVGKLNLDLRGNPKRDYDVRIRGGVGEATVRLPAEVGVVGEAEGGIGSIDAPGMTRHGNRFENDAYGKAKTTIHLDVRGGIGSIRLLSD